MPQGLEIAPSASDSRIQRGRRRQRDRLGQQRQGAYSGELAGLLLGCWEGSLANDVVIADHLRWIC